MRSCLHPNHNKSRGSQHSDADLCVLIKDELKSSITFPDYQFLCRGAKRSGWPPLITQKMQASSIGVYQHAKHLKREGMAHPRHNDTLRNANNGHIQPALLHFDLCRCGIITRRHILIENRHSTVWQASLVDRVNARNYLLENGGGGNRIQIPEITKSKVSR